MNLHTFVAASPAEAVSQVRKQLGPEAIVLNVRKVPGEGLARLWRKPRIELVACAPVARQELAAQGLDELRQELAAIRQYIRFGPAAVEPVERLTRWNAGPSRQSVESCDRDSCCLDSGETRSRDALERWIERSGLLPAYATRLLDEVRLRSGAPVLDPECLAPDGVAPGKRVPSPLEFVDQWAIAREILASWWPFAPTTSSNTHVLVGPLGSGKTTVLCKWMAKSVLMKNRRARVWRLDGSTANTAENLSIFSEVLGVPLERVQPQKPIVDPAELLFVDLPGVNWADGSEMEALATRLKSFPEAQVHLVLNAGYESYLLLAQARSFEALPIADVILTHLDEESHWAKIWNLVLGTNYSVSFVSAGQNVPGHFEVATPEKFLARDLG
jgi:flagellar biosynthesis protein FlhF